LLVFQPVGADGESLAEPVRDVERTTPNSLASRRAGGSPRAPRSAPGIASYPIEQRADAGRSHADIIAAARHSLSGVSPHPDSLARSIETAILGSGRVKRCGEEMVARANVRGQLVDITLVMTGISRDQQMRLADPEIVHEEGPKVDGEFRRCFSAALDGETVPCPGCREATISFEWHLQGGFNEKSQP
jgi:hypothetical protein